MKTHTLSQSVTILVLALLLAGALPLWAQPDSGRVSLVVGNVTFAGPGSESYQPVSRGDVLPVGSTVRSGPNSRAIIVAGPGSAVRVGPETTLELTQMAFAADAAGATSDRVLIDISEGAMSALIDREKDPNANFQVRTPHGVAAARGTIYAVSVQEDRSYGEVREGRVAIILNE